MAKAVMTVARQSMREEIVEAALDQFHSRGYNAAGVKDITATAGAPKGSFYNHFDSKEALALTALERYGETLRMRDLADASVAPVARLRAHFEFLRDETVGHGYKRGCMFGNFGTEIGDHSEVLRVGVEQNLVVWTTLVADVIGEAQRGGEVRGDLDPATTARFVVNAWEGTLIDARATRSADAFGSFFALVFGTLLTAPAKAPGEGGADADGRRSQRGA
ncbi:TetR/AcrR family transcriptional regulator [Sphaerisporangium dianthi]|uniref:TetR family transcriptional regulator C-terminal domain-containing protein n=1 Tax=Sphaerisporangium dianthi TaxID=1436120 RepID=A0ABV9CBW0_9ACTN